MRLRISATFAAPVLALGFIACASPARATALDDYVAAADTNYAWKVTSTTREGSYTVTQIELTSQNWRSNLWTHELLVIRPAQPRNPDLAFLFVTGDGAASRSAWVARAVAERAGVTAAVLTRVPNQPLYGNRYEDALIAYTFDKYARSGDATWPLLLPMVKSAVRAMDTLQAHARETHAQDLQRFVVSGASKRGWTSWLTAAADKRIAGVAPMVIDMLNIKEQLAWTKRVYGAQSEQIRDYTEIGLDQNIDQPVMRRLREIIDPYAYRDRYKLPTLILLGTNDPYWTVDALRHYWNDLPGPKLVYQTPNAGHGLNGGKEAANTLSAFVQMVADRQPLPEVTWEMKSNGNASVRVTANRPAKEAVLWTADSATRDFRKARWTSRKLALGGNGQEASASIETPGQGYRAFMVELAFPHHVGTGEYRVSTQVQVTPDPPK